METRPEGVYREELVVPASAVDRNGHVNNVVFVQWMQDIAVRHYASIGGEAASNADGATWVVRTHSVEYFAPAFAGDALIVETWVSDLRRVRSLRHYRFMHGQSGRRLVSGATDWVYVDRDTGRPRAVPETVIRCFTLLPPEQAPN